MLTNFGSSDNLSRNLITMSISNDNLDELLRLESEQLTRDSTHLGTKRKKLMSKCFKDINKKKIAINLTQIFKRL